MDQHSQLTGNQLASQMAGIQALAARWQQFCTNQYARLQQGERQVQIPEPASVQSAVNAFWQQVMRQPQPLIEAQLHFWQDWAALMQRHTLSLLGQAEQVEKAAGDKRFKDENWEKQPAYALLKDAYLLTSGHIQRFVQSVDGLDPHTAQQVAFYTRQLMGAMSPTNFLATNPVVMRTAMESKGENLLQGFMQMLDDVERNGGRLMPRMTDLEAFTLGENVAVTPGKVVFQNALMQLIQYAPSTEQVHKTPLLVMPPWINKFYILDLKPKNSLLKWLVDQGHTVFVISWVNPDASLRDKDFEDYMLEGPLAALDAIKSATGEDTVNAAAYCIGGTLLASTLAYMASGKDKRYPSSRIASASFFTTMIDFSEPGELGVFIDEAQLKSIEAYMNEKGYLEGHQMATVFNMLRENDLIWSFVVNNYLLGKEPMAFDLLYWNCDSTRMPAAMHRFYLRKMYQQNKLKEVGGVVLNGVAIDIRKIKVPAYFISAREDHIAPWKSTYMGARLFSGPVRFVLGGSGHIAGIVNPPAAHKYGYVTGDQLPATPETWLEQGKTHEGSWWLDWSEWLRASNGPLVAARVPGAGKLPALEDAPGSYVVRP